MTTALEINDNHIYNYDQHANMPSQHLYQPPSSAFLQNKIQHLEQHILKLSSENELLRQQQQSQVNRTFIAQQLHQFAAVMDQSFDIENFDIAEVFNMLRRSATSLKQQYQHLAAEFNTYQVYMENKLAFNNANKTKIINKTCFRSSFKQVKKTKQQLQVLKQELTILQKQACMQLDFEAQKVRTLLMPRFQGRSVSIVDALRCFQLPDAQQLVQTKVSCVESRLDCCVAALQKLQRRKHLLLRLRELRDQFRPQAFRSEFQRIRAEVAEVRGVVERLKLVQGDVLEQLFAQFEVKVAAFQQKQAQSNEDLQRSTIETIQVVRRLEQGILQIFDHHKGPKEIRYSLPLVLKHLVATLCKCEK